MFCSKPGDAEINKMHAGSRRGWLTDLIISAVQTYVSGRGCAALMGGGYGLACLTNTIPTSQKPCMILLGDASWF